MRPLPRCYAALLAFLLFVLSTHLSAQTELQRKVENITSVDSVKPLETTEFVEKYVAYFSQPLDHRRPEKVRSINVSLWHMSGLIVQR